MHVVALAKRILNLILAKIRSLKSVALAVASSGIAATLLDWSKIQITLTKKEWGLLIECVGTLWKEMWLLVENWLFCVGIFAKHSLLFTPKVVNVTKCIITAMNPSLIEAKIHHLSNTGGIPS